MAARILSGISIILAVLALLLVLTQPVSITIIKRKNFLLDFNFAFLGFVVDFSNSKKSANKDKGKKQSNPPYTLFIRVLSFCLSGSHLEIRKFNYPKFDSYYENPITNGIISVSVSAILAYLLSSASSYEIASSDDEDDANIYVILHTTLVHLIFTALLYFKETYKIKRKVRARI